MRKLSILFIISFFLLIGCSSKKKEISLIKETSQDQEIYFTYNEAYKALNEGDPYFAAKKFLEAELLFPQSQWAPRSALMASYAFYMQNYYAEALSNLDRYLKTYPTDKDLIYANYLIAMCYYETIEDEKRDYGPLLNAKEKFTFIVKEYPDTEFAFDAKLKLDLIEDILASKEMYLGRYYLKRKKWIAAMNRFKNVVNDYDQTIFIPEAIHRLVELNYQLGLEEEAKKYASLLGYNYLSNEWYEKSFKIFNNSYSIENDEVIKRDKKGVLNKFKKLFE